MVNNQFPPLGERDFNLIIHQFKPESLTLARELRGYTKAELAEMIGKTSGAISQFEHGIIRPDVITLKSLSMSLGVPANFFARSLNSNPIPIENCHFRSLRATSQKSRRQILANAKLLRNLIEILDEYVLFPPEKISNTAKKISGQEDIERYANEVRKAWGLGIGPIPNLMPLLEDKGIIISFIDQDNIQVDAFSFWEGGRPYIYLVPTKNSGSRTRFDCAHELGHLLMHADNIPGDKVLEAQADRFAGAFLLPREAFLKECPRRLNWDHFYELKKRWKVSVAALVRRAFDLECISEATYRRAFMQLNQNGQRFNELYETPQEKPTLIEQAIEVTGDESSINDLLIPLTIRSREFNSLIEISTGKKEIS
jgi:Zn-dependent peptidase ImmA (M78 family)/transcriptional regulator with XRE-family HTH domain